MSAGVEPGQALLARRKGNDPGGGALWDGDGHTQPHSLCASNPPSQHSFGQVSSWKCHEITTFFLSSQQISLNPAGCGDKGLWDLILELLVRLRGWPTEPLLNDLFLSDTNIAWQPRTAKEKEKKTGEKGPQTFSHILEVWAVDCAQLWEEEVNYSYWATPSKYTHTGDI